MWYLWQKLTENNSTNEDVRRRRRVLDSILLGWLILSTVGGILSFGISMKIGILKNDSQAASFPLILFFAASFFILYLLSRKGFYRIVSFIFLGIIFLIGGYISFSWRANDPTGILIYALGVVISGIILGEKYSFLATGISFLLFGSIAYLQDFYIIPFKKLWAIEPPHVADILVEFFMLLIIAIISWLSNHEMEKALTRARKSEEELKKQRDILEEKVEERTKELQEIQQEKLTQIYRFAEVGRLTAGLFHDLVNPLSVVSLNLQSLGKVTEQKELTHLQKLLKRATTSTRQLENFVRAARKQVQKQEMNKIFSLNEEIEHAIAVLNYKAQRMGVNLIFNARDNIETFGNPLEFYQIITNLVTNAIDAYEDAKKNGEISVIIKLKLLSSNIVEIQVHDFGIGIPKEHLDKIFEPLFTTKGMDKGTGLGLSLSKRVVEKSFGGKIQVESDMKKGTVFTVTFPLKDRKK